MHLPDRARIALLVAVFAGAGFSFFGYQLSKRAVRTQQTGMPSFSDFTVDTTAGPLALSDLQGKVVVVYFGYAGCPDICPTTLSTVGAALKSLPESEVDRVAGLFVSVDPDRDSVARLDEYAGFFHPHIRGGTTDEATLATIGSDWGVRWEKADGASQAMGYTVDHTSIVFLVGPDGRMKVALPHGSDPERLASEIQALLATDS